MSGQGNGEFADEAVPVVLSVGHYLTKVGEAGDDSPKNLFRTSVGCIDEVQQQDGDMEVEQQDIKRSFYLDQEFEGVYRDHMNVVSPWYDDHIVDWDLLQEIWAHAIVRKMKIEPSERPLLVSEPSNNTSSQREKMTEIAFEKFGTPGFFISKEATLAAYGSGRATGLIVDVGHSKTTVTPVHDGYVLQNAIKTTVGGQHISAQILRTVADKKTQILPQFIFERKKLNTGKWGIQKIARPGATESFYNYQVSNILDEIKTHLVIPDGVTSKPVDYELPDGTHLHLDSSYFAAASDLFKEGPEGSQQGIHQIIASSINSCDADIRRELYGGIIVTGGSSLYPGFIEQLTKSVNTPSIYKQKIIAPTEPTERRFSSWIGGSILGSLGSFPSMCISKAMYEEVGAHMVERKCP